MDSTTSFRFRGFGMNYALESGHLAARSILEGLNYDSLWKVRFAKMKKNDLSRRFAMLFFGDRAVEFAFRRLEDGGVVDFHEVNPRGPSGILVKEVFSRLEALGHALTNRW